MNFKPISCPFSTLGGCWLQIRYYWTHNLTDEEIKVHENLVNFPNHRVRKELEMEPECLVFPLFPQKALSWAELEPQLNLLLSVWSWAGHLTSVSLITLVHEMNIELHKSCWCFLRKHNAWPRTSALYTSAIYYYYYFDYSNFHNISASDFVMNKLKSPNLFYKFLVRTLLINFKLPDANLCNSRLQRCLLICGVGSSSFSATYKLTLPPGYLHKNTNSFVQKLWE